MKLIVDKDNIEFSFSLENDVTGDDIGSEVIAEGFKRQDERHITILGGLTSELLLNILSTLTLEERESILDQIKNLIEGLEWKFHPIEIYLISKTGCIDNPNISENRQSYIMRVDMPDMEVLYKKINTLLKSNLPVQMPHITLFTKGERENPVWYGIPVPSEEEFQKLNPQKIIFE